MLRVDVFDPWAVKAKVLKEYHFELRDRLDDHYDAIILAVAHQQFLKIDFQTYKANGTIIFDTKSFIDRDLVDARL